MVVTKLKLQLVEFPPLKSFSAAELVELEESFCVVTPPNTRLVHYSDKPPSDTSLPWQLTGSDQVTPIGEVKYFIGGIWTTK